MNGVSSANSSKTATTKANAVPANNGTTTQSSSGTGTMQRTSSITSNTTNSGSTRLTNGDGSVAASSKGKRTAPPAIDPSEVHEMVQSRIAALEGERVQGGEEEKRSAEEAKKTLKGLTLPQTHVKYVELYQEFKRQEREHAKERQKNKKESDASKTTLTNVQKLKSKTDAVVRDMQKQNKDLREEAKRLKNSLQQVELQLSHAKEDIQRRVDRDKKREKRYAEMPDIVIKVVCRYRAELFFKISRKTKLARLFSAWTERMDARSYVPTLPDGGQKSGDMLPKITPAAPTMQFLFTHMGRGLEPDQTPEDAGMEDGDEILAVEMMDLTGPEVEEVQKHEKVRIQKNWSLDPVEARHSIENIFDGVVRERLKDLLRQYELREKHFEAIIRSKELEVMLSKARTQEVRSDLEREAELMAAIQNQNNAMAKRLDDIQAMHQDLAAQIEMCHEFLFQMKQEDGDPKSRALSMFEALRHQVASQFEESDSVSETDQTTQDE
ncbi:hypothetical protein FRC14_004250 [Serendipita sp. 396]|nr:hypothetical protein FRC14_004250 [Serendipita sp. 396]KAG8782366.1 hypothetical protein FRC15_007071 [Serendipita sp. 397]KAG8837451.1 hypothetical protein FRC18_009290 [Serendipita sp. 400]KAG8858350.1 hypothetical protein FRB91_009935 [Serendipita sp. 411]KAG8866865.1 hypothetical protein FRC20_007318 [Serendipita sp. 405]